MDTSTSSTGPGSAAASAALAPIFVFPSQIDFYLEDATTHKRVITLYNPYETTVSFKVLCNNPKKYSVVEPEGRILAQKCADIVVRHVAIAPQAANNTDKFRIHLYDETATELLGKRDILATLYPGYPDPNSEKHSHSLPHKPRSPSGSSGQLVTAEDFERSHNQQGQQGHQQPNVVACLAAVICIVSLFLPTEGEALANSSLFKDYPWLHLSLNQKLVFAYVLGLVTMAILRTT